MSPAAACRTCARRTITKSPKHKNLAALRWPAVLSYQPTRAPNRQKRFSVGRPTERPVREALPNNRRASASREQPDNNKGKATSQSGRRQRAMGDGQSKETNEKRRGGQHCHSQERHVDHRLEDRNHTVRHDRNEDNDNLADHDAAIEDEQRRQRRRQRRTMQAERNNRKFGQRPTEEKSGDASTLTTRSSTGIGSAQNLSSTGSGLGPSPQRGYETEHGAPGLLLSPQSRPPTSSSSMFLLQSAADSSFPNAPVGQVVLDPLQRQQNATNLTYTGPPTSAASTSQYTSATTSLYRHTNQLDGSGRFNSSEQQHRQRQRQRNRRRPGTSQSSGFGLQGIAMESLGVGAFVGSILNGNNDTTTNTHSHATNRTGHDRRTPPAAHGIQESDSQRMPTIANTMRGESIDPSQRIAAGRNEDVILNMTEVSSWQEPVPPSSHVAGPAPATHHSYFGMNDIVDNRGVNYHDRFTESMQRPTEPEVPRLDSLYHARPTYTTNYQRDTRKPDKSVDSVSRGLHLARPATRRQQHDELGMPPPSSLAAPSFKSSSTFRQHEFENRMNTVSSRPRSPPALPPFSSTSAANPTSAVPRPTTVSRTSGIRRQWEQPQELQSSTMMASDTNQMNHEGNEDTEMPFDMD